MTEQNEQSMMEQSWGGKCSPRLLFCLTFNSIKPCSQKGENFKYDTYVQLAYLFLHAVELSKDIFMET